MSSAFRSAALPSLLLATLAACSGSSSGDAPATITLAVTDAASDQLSTFTIGLESVQLLSATNPPLSILPEPVAVDFAALTDLSRVLNVRSVPEDVYTGVEVTFVYEADPVRVHLHDNNVEAALLDADGNPLSGTHVLPIDFTVPLQVVGGNYVIELDLDLNQSVDVDELQNEVFFEPALLPRVNRLDPREHAVAGDLRVVQLENSRFRIALDGPPGSEPVVDVSVGPATIFQIDGQCLLGAAGLSLLDTLPLGSWVQAFGSMGAGSSRFQALTVEAGTGTYNGGTDIVEGVIVARTAGANPVLTVLGHSNDADHTSFQFNLTFTVNTSSASTKVVRRGSATQYSVDELNVGQRVRMFGALTIGPPNLMDVTSATDVVRLEPTWLFGTAGGAPAGGVLTLALQRVGLRDQADFQWSDSGVNAPNPAAFTVAEHNLGTGQGIGAGTPVVALGFFEPVDAPGSDFDAAILANRELLPSVLLVRDRLAGFTVTTTAAAASIGFAFSPDPTAPLERAVIDMGFAGQTDLVPTGVTLVPKPGTLGLGFYLLVDRTLGSVGLHFTFAEFAQALDAKLDGGASLFNVGALGVYDASLLQLPSNLVGVTVQ